MTQKWWDNEREMVKSKGLSIISPLAYGTSIEAHVATSLPVLECGLRANYCFSAKLLYYF